MREVEWYQIDIFGLTSTYNLCSGNPLLERVSRLPLSPALTRQSGVEQLRDLLTDPQLSSLALEFSLVSERVASLQIIFFSSLAAACSCRVTGELESISSSYWVTGIPWTGCQSISGQHRDTQGKKHWIHSHLRQTREAR
ncbi:hypothetical protein ILYODFUR_036782 [Ilyodon furcidens]|uniref:Uncharacterized protein n=1 Tax=Ilyodon furcidens TaxID=33524 RepID=A0ABV0V227_9TELE